MLRRILAKATMVLGWDQKGKPVSLEQSAHWHAVLIPELEVRQHCLLNHEISASISHQKPVLFIIAPELWYPFSSQYSFSNTPHNFIEYAHRLIRSNNINFGRNVVQGLPRSLHKEIVRLKHVLSSIPSHGLLNYSSHNISFGKLAATDLILKYKIHDFTRISDDHAQHYRDFILVSELAFLLGEYIQGKYTVDTAHAFNDYCPMSGFRLCLEANHVTFRTLSNASHKGADLTQFYFSRTWLGGFRRLKRQLWSEVQNLPLSEKGISESFEDLNTKLYRKNAFGYSPSLSSSQPFPTRNELLNGKPRLVSIFTSSLDEQVGSYYRSSAMNGHVPLFNEQLFDSQEGFLEWIIEHAEALTSSTEIYIRVHPRSGSDQRNSQTSQYLKYLRELSTRNSCSSLHFVWPENPLSSYYLGLQSDLCIIPWSSMVHELGRLGVPVLNLFVDHKSACQFPPDISLQVEGLEQLVRVITEADTSCIGSRILKNHRFYIWRTLSGTLSLDDIRPASKQSRQLLNHFLNLDLQTPNYNSHLASTNEIELEASVSTSDPHSTTPDYEAIIQSLFVLLNSIQSSSNTPIFALSRLQMTMTGMGA